MYSSTTDLQIINKNLGFDLIEDSTLEDTKLNLETNKYHIGYSSHEILLLKNLNFQKVSQYYYQGNNHCNLQM